MQQSSPKKHYLSSIGAGLLLVLGLAVFIPPAFARQPGPLATARQDVPPLLLIAMADPPDFLCTAPTGQETPKEEEKGGAITPFIGTNQTLTLLPTPVRPAIAASDVAALARPEVTAGVDVDLGTIKFNLGYTLPSRQVDEVVRPFGVDLEPGEDCKLFSLGVKIPF